MLLDACRLAVGTLTAVPVTSPRVVDRRRAGAAMALAPLAVLPLGGSVTAVAVAGHWLRLPAVVTALVALTVLILLNRALHLDGLSDTVDGLAASYDPERSLAVMKSGTSGPAGVVAVVLVLGLQLAGLTTVLTLTHWWQAAVLAGVAACASRAALVVCCARGVRAARPDGLGRTFTETVPRTGALVVWVLVATGVGITGVGAGLEWWHGVLAVTVALLAVVGLVARTTRRFGGVTGDVFGAAVEVALAVVLVVLSAGVA